jgi:hypothetical protein
VNAALLDLDLEEAGAAGKEQPRKAGEKFGGRVSGGGGR